MGTSIEGGVNEKEAAFLRQFSVKGRKVTLCVSRSVIGLIRNVHTLRRREHWWLREYKDQAPRYHNGGMCSLIFEL